MSKQVFDVELYWPEGTGTGTFFWAPFRVEEVFGSKAMVKVRGTLDGVPFRSVLMPNGQGQHYTAVNRELREALGKQAGDRVRVEMEGKEYVRWIEEAKKPEIRERRIRAAVEMIVEGVRLK